MKLTNLPTFGSIISAIVASICCIGPIFLAVIGVGGAGLFSKFESLRPYFIVITVALLGSAFYLAYRKREVECEDGSCELRSAGKWNKIALWVATVLVIFFFAFPYLIGLSNPGASIAQANVETSEVIIPVEGMTCAGCEFNVENAVKKLDGIIEAKADHQKGEVYVKLEKRKANVDDMVEAISKAGYKAIKQ